ncbi:hypothetical protein NVP1101O_147 [Vibrio phage 1.101.O._10N.261.45.C6]|nr:hypothetical protein NVP1101O_147 [Vibrio phage 1.101.O._10N.261.45.C6]
MPYQPSVTSRIQLATTSSTSANLGATLIATPMNYFKERTRPYNSFTEVQEDPAIPSTSVAYAALRSAFNAPSAAVPIYLGRQEVSKSIYTPVASRQGIVTAFSFTVSDGTTSVDVKHTSTTSEDLEAIATAVAALVTGLDVTATASGETVELTASGANPVIVTDVKYFTDSFESTETAAELYSALIEENEENFYFLTWTDHTESSVLAMAAEVETSESSNFPKIYLPATQDANSIVPQVEPAIDVMGKLKALGYNRTACSWHEQADTNYIDAFTSAFIGQFAAGSTTWKFVKSVGFAAAADPSTGKPLPTSKQGYIRDRNGSWYGIERGVTFNHGGQMASGEWIDTIRFKDWINDQIEVRLQNHLLNLPGNKASFTKSDINVITGIINGVLKDGVDVGGLSGYVGAVVPETISFSDQAERILQGVKWTGYLAGAIHFIIVDGILTYSEELQ